MRFCIASCLLLLPALATAQERVGPAPKQWDEMVSRALEFLKQAQGEDGSWSGNKSPGITGVVLTGALSSGRVGPNDALALKSLKYIESLINPTAKHIAGKDPK